MLKWFQRDTEIAMLLDLEVDIEDDLADCSVFDDAPQPGSEVFLVKVRESKFFQQAFNIWI